MVPELEKPRVTEIQVRMDCNGCVQKIKKALHGINGIYDLYIDFPQQKITIIGWADPEKIVKAIKKTRKSAIICSHTEPPNPQAQPSESATQGEAPPSESDNPPPPESANPPLAEGQGPPAEGASITEPPKDPQPTENPKTETKPSPDAAEASASQPVQPSGPKDVEEVHLIYHHPPDYGYRQDNGYRQGYGYRPDYGYRYDYNPSMVNPNMGQGYRGPWHSYPSGPGFRPETPPPPSNPGFRPETPPPPFSPGIRTESAPLSSTGFRTEPPPPVYVTHSYNTHRASPYVTGYEYIRPPPPQYTYYTRPDRYSEEYYYANNGNGNITSVFSDENPNACRIV